MTYHAVVKRHKYSPEIPFYSSQSQGMVERIAREVYRRSHAKMTEVKRENVDKRFGRYTSVTKFERTCPCIDKQYEWKDDFEKSVIVCGSCGVEIQELSILDMLKGYEDVVEDEQV